MRLSASDPEMIYRKFEFIFKSGEWRGGNVVSGVKSRINTQAYTLIYGHSDHSLSRFQLNRLFRKGFRKIAGTNTLNGGRTMAIPLGLTNLYPDSPLHLILGDLEVIKEALQARIPRVSFRNSCYANFNIKTHKSRLIAAKEMSSLGINRVESEYSIQGRRKFCLDVANSDFVICPRGNGVDTHRFWEALYLGSIPIVLKDPHLSSFTSQLPCLELENWGQLSNTSFLEESYYRLRAMQWDPRLLTADHWLQIVRQF